MHQNLGKKGMYNSLESIKKDLDNGVSIYTEDKKRKTRYTVLKCFMIFSQKKEIRTNQKKERPKIIADIHEKDSMILSELKSNKEIDLEITSLEIGDYQVGGTIIERKTTSDFISSIITKRLIRQIIQMQQYKQKVIIIEGEINDLYNKINPNAVRGFILSISLNYNINLIFTTSYKRYNCLSNNSRKTRIKTKDSSLASFKNSKNKK